MSALLRASFMAAFLVGLAGCPEKKPEESGAVPPAASSAPAKAPAPGAGGW